MRSSRSIRAVWPLVAILSAALTACGGGGGGGGDSAGPVGGAQPGASSPAGAWLTITPSPVSVSATQGDSTSFSITAKSSRTFDKQFNVAIIDSKGVVTTDVAVTAVSMLEYVARLRTAPTLAPGSHDTSLEVRLCEDDPLTCRSPLPGSPWRVPLNVTVKPAATGGGTVGDGGNDGAVDMTDGSWLTLALSPAAITVNEGETASLLLSARSTRNLPLRTNIGVFDDKGALATDIELQPFSERYIGARLHTTSTLAAGTHGVNLQVRLCEDDPRVCKTPLPGSPWLVPLSVTVKSGTNLTPLSVMPGVGAWSTFQGNAAHTGFIPATFSSASFNRRWSATLSPDRRLNPIAVDNGKVFVTRWGHTGEWALTAISEDTGKTLWSANMSGVNRIHAPAAANGKVFVTSSGHENTFFWVFDQTSGALLAKTPMSSQFENYLAPTVVGDSVYTNSGYYGGLSKFRGDGSLEWFNGYLPQQDGWTPAVDASHAYAYMKGQLHAIRTADGVNAFQIDWPDHTFMGSAVVLGRQLAYVTDSGRLVAFDLAKRSVAWTVSYGAVGLPALANDILYGIGANGVTLEARAARSGELVWEVELAAAQSDRFDNVIVTNSHVFASSPRRTMAIDLATRALAWDLPAGGSLSMSERGVLYIVTPDGKVMAVNLR